MSYSSKLLAQSVAVTVEPIAEPVVLVEQRTELMIDRAEIAGRHLAQLLILATSPAMVQRYQWAVKLAMIGLAWLLVSGAVLAYEAGKACGALYRMVQAWLEGGDAMSAALSGDSIVAAQGVEAVALLIEAVRHTVRAWVGLPLVQALVGGVRFVFEVVQFGGELAELAWCLA